MLSYLGAIQELIDPNVYGRGVRMYLEGKVSQPKELLLDFWREYEVYDKGATYVVTTPLYHLAMDNENWSQASEAMSRYTTCTCEYFQELGLCKHTAAVMASIEQEFHASSALTTQRDSSDIDTVSVLDSFFDAQQTKQARVWETRLEQYYSQSKPGIEQWMNGCVSTVHKHPEDFTQFITRVSQLSKEALMGHQSEKRVVTFMLFSLSYGSKVWWDIWYPLFEYVSPKRIADMFYDLWLLRQAGVVTAWRDQLDSMFTSISEESKTYLIERLQSSYPTKFEMWIEFVFVSRAQEWIVDNLNSLSPLYLIRAAQMVPDHQEDVEIRVLNQVKIWSDYLTVGDYTEIGEVFSIWKRILGHSSYYQEAVDYFKKNHPKKKKLLQLL